MIGAYWPATWWLCRRVVPCASMVAVALATAVGVVLAFTAPAVAPATAGRIVVFYGLAVPVVVVSALGVESVVQLYRGPEVTA